MARGRFLSNEITKDKRINDLSSDTSRLAFTWLIAFADCEGRTHGDPALVRSIIFPRRTDISIKQIEALIKEWHNAGLIVWYEADGDYWIHFPKFEKHQVGLRKDREPSSSIPAPPARIDGEVLPDDCRKDDGQLPEESPVNVKLSESNNNESSPSGDVRAPKSKPKTEFVIAMEKLEQIFADTRGCKLPDWKNGAKEANKRWRTPLGRIYNELDKDIKKAEYVVRSATKKLKKDELTFDAPDQILKTALSMIINLNSGEAGGLPGYKYVGDE